MRLTFLRRHSSHARLTLDRLRGGTADGALPPGLAASGSDGRFLSEALEETDDAEDVGDGGAGDDSDMLNVQSWRSRKG